jgi:hypothetical protein
MALQGNGFRQMYVAAICGALFWLFLRGFAPWAVKSADFFGFIGAMLLAACRRYCWDRIQTQSHAKDVRFSAAREDPTKSTK